MELYKTYGCYREALVNITLKGKEGADKIQAILADFREFPPVTVAGKEVVSIEDYKESVHTDLTNDSTKVIDLPKSNVLKYTLSDGSWFVLRSSGTEPKAKVYIGVIADVIDAADAQVAKIKEDVLARVNKIIA